METLTPAQVHAIVEEMRTANYKEVGQGFFDQRSNRLEDAGWKLGVQPYSHRVTHARRGRKQMLATPRLEWRYVAYYYQGAPVDGSILRWRVFYWDNPAITKREAVDMATRTPPPEGAFLTFTK